MDFKEQTAPNEFVLLVLLGLMRHLISTQLTLVWSVQIGEFVIVAMVIYLSTQLLNVLTMIGVQESVSAWKVLPARPVSD